MGRSARRSDRSQIRPRSMADTNRTLPVLAYLARIRTQDRQVPGLVLQIQTGAHPAVVAGGPAAIIELGLIDDGVLEVLPEPVLLEAGVEVVPGEDLVLVALAPPVPVDIDAGLGARPHPGLVVEVLVPPVEARTQLESSFPVSYTHLRA